MPSNHADVYSSSHDSYHAQLILCVRTSNHDSLSNLNNALQTNILHAYLGTSEDI